MRKGIAFTILLILSITLMQCNRAQDDTHHMMSEGQMSQFMQNPEQRQAMMTQMMQNPEMLSEFMSQMHTNLMSGQYQDQMLDRMEMMMTDEAQREQMRTQMQRMLEMLDSEEIDRQQLREMMNQSPMMGMHMNCLQMMDTPE